MLTIAVIDKFPIIRTGIEIMLRTSIQDVCVLSARSIVSLLTQHPSCEPDVLIVGIDSESIVDPFVLMPLIKDMFRCPVIIYDDLQADHLCLKYFSAGASGYISKCNSHLELLECINAVTNHRSYANSEALEMLVRYLPTNNSAINEGIKREINELTKNEYNIAKYLCSGMKLTAIAEKLQKNPSAISFAKSRIFKKLNINSVIKLNSIIDAQGRMVLTSVNSRTV